MCVKSGFFSKWVLRPPFQVMVKLCDWTDSLLHRGVKNGIRIATAIYIVEFWLLLLVYAIVLVLVLIFGVIALIIALRLMTHALGGESKPRLSLPRMGRSQREIDLLGAAGRRGQKVYSGTNWLNEELKGRVDEKGNIYSGSNFLTEEKIGKIDAEGNIYRGTNWLNEELVGKIDKEGNIQKGTNWLNQEKVGRIDKDGNVYEGTNWLSERKIGRSGN